MSDVGIITKGIIRAGDNVLAMASIESMTWRFISEEGGRWKTDMRIALSYSVPEAPSSTLYPKGHPDWLAILWR